MFSVVLVKYYRDVDDFSKYDYLASVWKTIMREKLSECMDDVKFLKENNDVNKFSPWEIMYVKDLSEEEGDANE